MPKVLSTKELQQDVADLLDYLHLTSEENWDFRFIREKIMVNIKRFDENIKYYYTPVSTHDYVKLIYSKEDVKDLIGTLTTKYVAVGKLKLKEEYQ